ncbi:MAG: SDR family oxidoreductase [Trueperaceae bacterium]|nr:SDR family oxidoreductase [Trueperaceae bacterium]
MIASFEGQTVVVAGGAHGFGRAIALAFVERGASVWTCDLLAEGLAETTRLSEGMPGTLTTRVVDVTDAEAVRAFVAAAEAGSGSAAIDVLVHNAGGVGGQVGRPLEEVSLADWRILFSINVEAAFTFAQAAAPGMKREHKGRIVHISSGAGLGVSLTGIQAYASAKAAQIGLTRQLAHELGPWGITVNNVAPGFVLSNPTTQRQWESYGDEGQRALVERIALKRLGTPEDIANAVVFFASPYAGWISGQVLSVDGGK